VALAESQRLLYRLFCRIQALSLQWLRLTGVLAVPGIQSAPLTRCPGTLNPLLSDTSSGSPQLEAPKHHKVTTSKKTNNLIQYILSNCPSPSFLQH